MDTTTVEPTVIGVLVTRVYDHNLNARIRECGRTFRYETHTANPELALHVSCLCPRGHGVAGIAWRGWLSTRHGKFDLADITVPDRDPGYAQAPALMEVPDDLADLDIAQTCDADAA